MHSASRELGEGRGNLRKGKGRWWGTEPCLSLQTGQPMLPPGSAPRSGNFRPACLGFAVLCLTGRRKARANCCWTGTADTLHRHENPKRRCRAAEDPEDTAQCYYLLHQESYHNNPMDHGKHQLSNKGSTDVPKAYLWCHVNC